MIKNEYTVTWKLYREWLIENKLKGAKLAFLIFWSFMAVATFVISCFSNLAGFYILMTIYCVYQAIFRDYIFAKKQYNKLAQFCGGENWTRTITISDEDICISEGPSVLHFKNTDVVRVVEKGNKICLIMNGNTVLRMYKSAFIEGSWETCPMSFR